MTRVGSNLASFLVSAVVAAVFACPVGCSGGGGGAGGDAAGGDQRQEVADGAAGDASAGHDGAAAGDALGDAPAGDPLPLGFHVAYTTLGRVANDNLNQSDLLVMLADGTDVRSLTDFIRSDDAVAYTCHNSCVIDRSLTWLAVATGPPDESGFFDFKMGRFNAQQQVSIDKSAPLQDVVDLHFGVDYLYYTKLFRVEGPSRQYSVTRVSLARPAEREELGVFPPDDVLEDSTYIGHFSVNPEGRELVFLNPTIRSQSVYVWRDGAFDQIDYICPVLRNGACTGAGSDYSDVDPVAISRDGRYVALFVVAGRDLRVRLYDLQDLATKPYLTLAQVAPGKAYLTNICKEKEPWQYAEVAGQPVFSPDGASVYFVGMNDPSRAGCDMDKAETDILRLDVARIREPRPIEEGDLFSVTRIPKTGDAAQVVIEEFDLSPDGSVVVFSGTPSFLDTGGRIPDGSSRHENDLELWVQGVDGRRQTQLTSDKRWEARSPVTLP